MCSSTPARAEIAGTRSQCVGLALHISVHRYIEKHTSMVAHVYMKTHIEL